MSEETQVKLYEMNTQSYELKVKGPATVEEFDRLAQKPGRALELAVDGVIYRGTIPDFWDAFIPKVEAKYGITRGTDDKATASLKAKAKTTEAAAKVKDVPEKFSSYDKRVRAQLTAVDGDGKIAKEQPQLAELDALAAEVAAGLTVDPSPSARGSKGPSKDLLAKADSILALTDDEIEAKVQKWTDAIAPATFELARDPETGRPTRESLAYFAGEVLKTV